MCDAHLDALSCLKSAISRGFHTDQLRSLAVAYPGFEGGGAKVCARKARAQNLGHAHQFTRKFEVRRS